MAGNYDVDDYRDIAADGRSRSVVRFMQYNLRGLDEGGRCPECGESILQSIAANEYRRSVAPRPFTDRRVVLELLEGAIFAIAALLTAVAIVFMPIWAFELKTRARAIMLGVMVSAFVFAWFAAWKLSAPEGDARFESRRSARRLLRNCLVAILVTSAVAFVVTRLTSSDVPLLAYAVVYVIVQTAAAFLYYVHVGQILRRLGGTVLPILCYILAPLNALLAFAGLLPELDGDGSSIGTMWRFSTVQFGNLEWIHQIFLGFRWNNTASFSNFVGIAWLILVPLVHLWLLILAMRTNRVLKETGQGVRMWQLY
jgi:hypothetical protein